MFRDLAQALNWRPTGAVTAVDALPGLPSARTADCSFSTTSNRCGTDLQPSRDSWPPARRYAC
jgi:hypothetical protein